MKEIWKPIREYEKEYEVSNFGNIRSLDRFIIYQDGRKLFRKGKQLTPVKTTWGYLTVKLFKNGIGTRKHIHTLVAEAFIPNPKNLLEVNHKNHDKEDNFYKNLEWVTHKDNMFDMVEYNYQKGRFKATKMHPSKKPSKARMTKNPGREEILKLSKTCKNYEEIAKKYKVTSNCVKKWFIKNNIELMTFSKEVPEKNDLLSSLNTQGKEKTAKKYGVCIETLNRWIKLQKIQFMEVIIMDSVNKFYSRKEVYNIISPECAFSTFRDNIKRASNQNKVYLNHRWKIEQQYI